MKIQIHESVGPLLRGIGLSIVLIGTVAGAIQAKTRAETRLAHAPVPKTSPNTTAVPGSIVLPQDDRLQTLTQEVAYLRETMQEETAVDDVLTSPWFETLGFLGSCLTASSFYAEWLSKRSKPFTEAVVQG
jgi:hypothetical protein